MCYGQTEKKLSESMDTDFKLLMSQSVFYVVFIGL